MTFHVQQSYQDLGKVKFVVAQLSMNLYGTYHICVVILQHSSMDRSQFRTE